MKTKAIFISLIIVTFISLSTLALASTQIIWDPDTLEVVLKPGTYLWEDDIVTDPHVIYDNGVYKMWYRGWGTWPDPNITFYEDAIGYATSTDGVHWSNRQLVHGPKPGYPQTKSPFVIKEGSNYQMWVIDYYEWVGGEWSGYVWHMTSSNGIDWEYGEKVLSAQGQPEPQGDGYNIYSVSVLDEESHYTMWYSVQDLPDTPSIPPNRLKIWRATSTDGIYWPLENRQLSMPYIKDTWEDNVRHPHVVRDDNGGYTMYYAASSFETGWNLATTTSEDGITWNNRQQIGVPGGNPCYFENVDGTPYLYFDYDGQIFRMTGNKVPEPDISGCIEIMGEPLVGVEITLKQQGGLNLTVMTDLEGCYKFENANVWKKIKLEVEGP